jgi:hypothetical protein
VTLEEPAGEELTKDNVENELKSFLKICPGAKTRVIVRDTTDRVYEGSGECFPSPGAIEGMARALNQFVDCSLSPQNCASFDVANRRIRNTARIAVNQVIDES